MGPDLGRVTPRVPGAGLQRPGAPGWSNRSCFRLPSTRAGLAIAAPAVPCVRRLFPRSDAPKPDVRGRRGRPPCPGAVALGHGAHERRAVDQPIRPRRMPGGGTGGSAQTLPVWALDRHGERLGGVKARGENQNRKRKTKYKTRAPSYVPPPDQHRCSPV